jgi:hypothetical protein
MNLLRVYLSSAWIVAKPEIIQFFPNVRNGGHSGVTNEKRQQAVYFV